MKKTLIIAAVFAAALAVSCQERIIEESVKHSTVTFTCRIGEPDSRLSIESSGKVCWEEGDEILFHYGEDGNDRQVVTLAASDISADGKSATITLVDAEPYDRTDYRYVSKYYAIYPASAVTSTNPLYYETRVSDLSLPAMGGYDDGEGNFIFKNLFGVIRYTVSGNFDSISFTGNGDEVVSYGPDYQVRLALKDDGSEDYRRTSSNGASSSPLKVLDAPVVGDGSTVNYICIPGGVNLTSGFTIKFKKDGETKKIAETNSPLNLGRNNLLDLGNITSKLKTYTPPTSSSHRSEIKSATDLSSAKGPANSYIISAAGKYKMPVVKGNSTTSAGNVFGVELVWESFGTADAPVDNAIIAAVDFDGPENYVYFQTPSPLVPGNALIAAKDSEGSIIWSWHIWIPETAISSDADGYGISSKEMMDRNLGALVVAGTRDNRAGGLHYQWGRKDPFLGVRAYGTSSIAKCSGTAKTTYTADASAKMTIAESIKNPTVFSNFKGDWVTPSDGTLWGTPKTQYDPCPPGWKVPDKHAAEGLFYITDASEFTYDAANYCFTVGDAVFPLTGHLYYSNGNIDKRDVGARLWTANSSSDDLAKWFAINAADDFNTWDERKDYGCSIRCVAEDAE